jgi:hypothetical protein
MMKTTKRLGGVLVGADDMAANSFFILDRTTVHLLYYTIQQI